MHASAHELPFCLYGHFFFSLAGRSPSPSSSRERRWISAPTPKLVTSTPSGPDLHCFAAGRLAAKQKEKRAELPPALPSPAQPCRALSCPALLSGPPHLLRLLRPPRRRPGPQPPRGTVSLAPSPLSSSTVLASASSWAESASFHLKKGGERKEWRKKEHRQGREGKGGANGHGWTWSGRTATGALSVSIFFLLEIGVGLIFGGRGDGTGQKH